MKKITFTCETITPMFLAGADGRTPELHRSPSLKGMLRYWWRAIQATPVNTLHEKEGNIFGSSEEGIGKSTFRLILKGDFETIKEKPLPHHTNDKKSFPLPAIKAGTSFQIITDANKGIQNLIILSSILGGLGKRSRRGFGSFEITHVDNKPLPNISMESILTRLNEIASNYILEGAKIISKDISGIDYPYIKSIQLGASVNSYQVLLQKIGKTSSTFDSRYTGFIDTRNKKRYASPIYVSSIRSDNDKYFPIITELNTVFEPGTEIGKNLKQLFIGALL